MAELTRPSRAEMVKATERILGRRWAEMTTTYGDWGRDGLLAVATRHLSWSLAEVVREVPGLSYAAAQGIRRFWQLTLIRPEMQSFAEALTARLSKP